MTSTECFNKKALLWSLAMLIVGVVLLLLPLGPGLEAAITQIVGCLLVFAGLVELMAVAVPMLGFIIIMGTIPVAVLAGFVYVVLVGNGVIK